MPKPVEGNQRYVAGLDGLRALAVLAVIAYHVNLGWAQGGLLGVGIFFTLSGYLITDLLLAQQATTGSLNLLRFWQRRARRLLPALFVMLTLVTAWVALLQRSQLPALRGAVAAAACYVSNWWLIAQNSSYFARFAPPTPLGHLWSLAVEEQFYLLWPWLIMAGLYVTRRLSQESRTRWMAGGTLALAAVSAGLMVAFYHPGYDPTRVYDGTDTRAFALLIGAALAIALPSRKMPAQLSQRRRLRLDGLGCAGLIVIALLIWRTSQYSPFLYRGGMVLLSVATAAVVLAVVSPAGRLGTLLGWLPLRWLGVRSYGIYLWHYPIIVLTTPANGTETPLRATLQIGASIVIAALSWRLVEEPVRHGAIGRWVTKLRADRVACVAPRVGDVERGMLGARAFGGSTRGRDARSFGRLVSRDNRKHVAGRACGRQPRCRARWRESYRGRGQAPRVPAEDVLHIGRPFRRLHVRWPGVGGLPARSGSADQRAVRRCRRQAHPLRDRRRHLDRGDDPERAQCVHAGEGSGPPRLSRLLGAGARH